MLYKLIIEIEEKVYQLTLLTMFDVCLTLQALQ